ncbi:MAG: ABC-three component system middle component 1 [Candidatus Saccharimonadales bacterium]|jgi:hypothetical protein
MMQEIVSRATRTNGYEQLTLQAEHVSAFRSPKFKDVLLVANYSSDELIHFDDCVTTTEVMDAYDEICKIYPDALRSTSLVICHKVSDVNERDAVKNTILKIEENSFGLRKFIVSYTDTSIRDLLNIEESELVSQLHAKVESGFSAFIDSKATNSIEEYDIVLQLFIKLPFMKMQSSRAKTELISLPDFLADKISKHSSILGLVQGQSTDEDMYDIFQQNNNLDLEIDNLLQDPDIDLALNPTKGQE